MKTKKAALAQAARMMIQHRDYPTRTAKSSSRALRQAADVLYLLTAFPLTPSGRTGFAALLERRLQRAYEGTTR